LERSEADKSVKSSFRQRALVIWKEQTRIHQHTQHINVDIL